ncbi:MAG TPA: U32 family peptidase C-terminal domain-containing protein [Pseudobdellovibrionaceae bacterium]|jgi:putative protease
MFNQELELLMPAGSLEKLKYAFNYGADAVYAGVPLFSLRARENEFNLEDLKEGIHFARERNKKVYFTANIFARNLKLKPFTHQIKEFAELQPDALIMSDPGLISIVKEQHPELQIHLSVQANCMNWQSVKFWQKQGVSRVILSRELRLDEIKEIKDRVPDIELEAFVHGSICIAYSGRCLLSHYMSHRDANQGVCDNSCRYGYNIHKAETEKEEHYYLEDLRNKGEFYPIDEDENGTYIMNSKDLCLIEHLKEMAEAGVCSFKVEGRTKSVYYVAMVSKIYRQALNDLKAGRPFNAELYKELDKVASRGYHKGFLMGNPTHEAQNYSHSTPRQYSQKFAALLTTQPDSSVVAEVRNKMQLGDAVEVISPKTVVETSILGLQTLEGEPLKEAHGGAGIYKIDLGVPVENHSLLSIKSGRPL